MFTLTLSHYLVLSLVLFSIGVAGVLLRRNIIIVLMSLELIFNSVNISLVAFSHYLQDMSGRVFVVFSITVAAAEVAVGLAILVLVYRRRNTVYVEELDEMRN
ncbi:MAG TPA: NADH-quinone oxidoreductase subunit NuoK [Deltaproteobacteria bacterium]|nr:NADH-quinone oxidoreductase subunit NuoK [Deltaproteobacteria bacterium]